LCRLDGISRLQRRLPGVCFRRALEGAARLGRPSTRALDQRGGWPHQAQNRETPLSKARLTLRACRLACQRPINGSFLAQHREVLVLVSPYPALVFLIALQPILVLLVEPIRRQDVVRLVACGKAPNRV